MIFLGLDNTCGYYTQLRSGLEAIGYKCLQVNAFPNRGYDLGSIDNFLSRLISIVGLKTNQYARGSVKRMILITIKIILLQFMLLYSIFVCKTYVFSGGFTFSGFFDLLILKILKKKIIIIFHGSDSRPPFISGLYVNADQSFDLDKCFSDALVIKRRIRICEKYADYIINNPAASHFHSRPIINWFCIGNPFEKELLLKNTKVISKQTSKIKILHAPTRPFHKGTPIIEAAISRLERKGFPIDYVKIVNKTNEEVLIELSSCDLVIDELYSDIFMASFACEAAIFSCPAIVGQYESEKIKSYITDSEMIPPVIVCTDFNFEEVLENVVSDTVLLQAAGEKANKFLNDKWSSVEVAKRFVRLIDDDVPLDWWFDPSKIDRMLGWGMNQNTAKSFGKAYVKHFGLKGLFLFDQPKIQKRFQDFVNDI